jgi:hypothetical protein
MKYPIRCGCARVYWFAAAQAGNHYTCPCGRELIVPPLSHLKIAAGQKVLSPEVRLDQMLRLGMLPQESRCMGCGAGTEAVTHFWAVCERAYFQKKSTGWALLFLGLFLGWFKLILHLAVDARDDRELGTDVQLRLPLRICPDCRPVLATPGALRDAVLSIPVYADLFDKYPKAALALDRERQGVDLSAPPRE